MNIALRLIFSLFIILTLFMSGCTSDSQKPNALFKLLPSNETGITFSNVITQSDSLNILEYMYFYNGGGVGVGDINNDGLTDVFFTGNMVTSKLYLNKENFQFQDITQQAGITTKGWCTGVAVVDINNDGYLDIYVCRAGSKIPGDRANQLFINNRNNTFTESAQAYGIADTAYTTQAAFFDYDKDGDLDLYLLTHDHSPKTVNNIDPIKEHGEGRNTDKLYRNNGNIRNGHPTFTDVSAQAGIQIEGYGLGVAISDINSDGWPDIYVSNDFSSNDLLYINNQNGTFTNRIRAYLKHESYNGMGADVSDFNNDGHPDIVVVDMLPEDNYRQKMMLGSMTNENFDFMLERGYEPQYMRNTLQLNNGNGHFSEIAQLAGVDKTDWSWSPLFADFDNDGFKDLFITNGYLKDITDRDFIVYSHNKTVLQDAKAANKTLLELMNKQQGVKLPNYAFKNNHNLTFSKAVDWGFDQPSFSNGDAFADLDNDGDLDLVINNINDEAFIYRNESEKTKKNNYLQISLVGDSLNTFGLGTKVTIYHQGNIQYYEHNLYRGYESSVTNVIHFGLGNINVIDSVNVLWPDGKVQQLVDVPVNQRIVVNKKDAAVKLHEKPNKSPTIFSEVSALKGIRFLHKENRYSDLTSKPLMPHTYSTMGPAMAAGDVDGNGLDDFFIGGSAGNAGSFYFQDKSGHFTKQDFAHDIEYEDMGALLFDADNDNDLDLYIVSGGSEFAEGSAFYQDRLYKNDGKGNFKKDSGALPVITASGSCVTAADFDRDGDLDLFVGGRFSPGKYPLAPESYILENRGGKFINATDRICGGLKNIGMVTSALWTDFDNDSLIDLLVVGEWMPITIFKNVGGKLINVTASAGLGETSGWWNSIAGGDIDNDGDMDYIIGNLGLNNPFRASMSEPLTLISGDFDQSGIPHTILTWYNGGKNYPWSSKDVMLGQMPRLGKKFFMYNDFAKATITDIIPSEIYKKASVLKSTCFSTSYLENLGGGKFELKPLPIQAQFAPVNGIIIRDVDHDGNLDCLLTGNWYAPDVSIGRYDAFTGLYLRGNGKGNFANVPVSESGFFINSDSRSLIQLYSGSGEALIAGASNSDSLLAYSQKIPQGTTLFKLQHTDVFGSLITKDSRKRKLEFYYGSGYLSQSSRTVEVPPEADSVVIIDSQGNGRSYNKKHR
ncbi:RNA-binding protein [Ilyomonas limi]|uniref:RNA-binding protein n=1 Tax=Ilyomonas limi TaxID=2575867 RepID=A0A4U3KU09_9BACT|nr:VCBS repeat-containing protein [Ilyomonas limi]TKK66025.1 RNA-binding protein [Ilyomonas limi]